MTLCGSAGRRRRRERVEPRTKPCAGGAWGRHREQVGLDNDAVCGWKTTTLCADDACGTVQCGGNAESTLGTEDVRAGKTLSVTRAACRYWSGYSTDDVTSDGHWGRPAVVASYRWMPVVHDKRGRTGVAALGGTVAETMAGIMVEEMVTMKQRQRGRC